MGRFLTLALLALIPLASGELSWGQTPNPSPTPKKPLKRVWHLQAGLELGPVFLKVSDPNDFDMNGFHFQLRGGAVFYHKRWLFDTNLGYFSHTLTGTSKDGKKRSEIGVGAFFLDFSPRWILWDNFGLNLNLGPAFELAVGSDLRYTRKAAATAKIVMPSIGAKLGFEWMTESLLIKTVLTFYRSLGLTERSLYQTLIGFEFGLPMGTRKQPEPKPTPTPSPTPLPEPTPTPSPTPAPPPPPEVIIDLGFDQIQFKTDKWELYPNSKQALLALGKYLSENLTLWSSLRIDGHADKRGKEERNVLLSRNRALAVAATLIQAGAPRERMGFYGYGSSQPLIKEDSPDAWKRNRRVKLTFSGVKDASEFKDKVFEILKTQAPE